VTLLQRLKFDNCHLPHFQVLVITDSQIPNIGIRTLWGLSGLRVLDLSRNRLTNVIDKNFDGLYSLREVRLDGNEIRSMVSAAFRWGGIHQTQAKF
jgi:Leucine-rich repeat (LRR) protein